MQLVIAFVVAASFALAAVLQRASRYFPTNLLVAHTRRNGLARLWLLPVLAVGYLGGAAQLLQRDTGQPSMLAVVAFLFCWNGIKLATATAVLPLQRVFLAGRHRRTAQIAL